MHQLFHSQRGEHSLVSVVYLVEVVARVGEVFHSRLLGCMLRHIAVLGTEHSSW